MELATQTHLTPLRDALNDRLRELRAEVHAAEQAQRGQAARENALDRSSSRTASS